MARLFSNCFGEQRTDLKIITTRYGDAWCFELVISVKFGVLTCMGTSTKRGCFRRTALQITKPRFLLAANK